MDMLDEAPTAILDFSVIPNGMISGLTGPEIDELMKEYAQQQPDNKSTTRFSTPQSDETIQTMKNESVPLATVRRNKWSLNLYKEWQNQRNKHLLPGESYTDELKIQFRDIKRTEAIDYWVSKFILEVRKRDGTRYPRDSLVSIIAGLNANIKENIGPVNIFKDINFSKTQESLDLSMKLSTSEGVEINEKQAEIISFEDEEKLWTHAFGDNDPQKLQDTLFYLNGLHFAMRSGQEHRDLTTTQLEIKYDPPSLIYSEKQSKTYNGGLKQRRIDPKKVVHVDIFYYDNPQRSHVRLYEKYLSVRPKTTDVFYIRSLKKYSTVWYSAVPVGNNTLRGFMKRLCATSGVEGHKTNHSCRATCTTRLYESGFDDHSIMRRTGHRSSDGLKPYKRMGETHNITTSAEIENRPGSLSLNINNKKKDLISTSSNIFNFNNGCIVNFYQNS